MKILIGLSVLQTAAIIVLFSLLMSALRQPLIADTNYRDVRPPVDGMTPASLFDEQRLRAIIREELAGQQKRTEADETLKQSSSTKPNVDSQAVVQAREQRDRVGQAIESYKSVGSITDPQMQELLDEIGQLDELSRRQAMSSLIRALNAGTLKGRLQ